MLFIHKATHQQQQHFHAENQEKFTETTNNTPQRKGINTKNTQKYTNWICAVNWGMNYSTTTVKKRHCRRCRHTIKSHLWINISYHRFIKRTQVSQEKEIALNRRKYCEKEKNYYWISIKLINLGIINICSLCVRKFTFLCAGTHTNCTS